MRRVSLVLTMSFVLMSAFGCGSKDAASGSGEATAKADKASAAAKPEQNAAGVVKIDKPTFVKPVQERLSASHILIMHKDSARPDPKITRTKEEALKIAEDIYAQLQKGADFAKLAQEKSDCPSGKEAGGDLGIFPAEAMAKEFSDAVRALKYDEISKPVETPFGYHIIKRQEIVEIHARHILVMHQESKRKPPYVTRTKDEARKLIAEIAKKLEDGADFAEMAREYSDCPTGKRAGGDLGRFTRGRMAPAFEKAAFALKENEISGVVETDFGFHLIQRLP
jgi:peptidyl-prolyl cis-trans isomerase SurA